MAEEETTPQAPANGASAPADNGRGASIRFALSEDGVLLRATFPPHDPKATPQINGHWLRQKLAEAGFGELYLNEDAVAHLVERYNSGEGDGGDLEPIAERRDAVIQLKVSADKMEATAYTTPAYGGEPLTRQAIHNALMAEGIVFGVKDQALEELLSSTQISNTVIAVGRPPEAGEDTRFESLIPEARKRGPVIDDRGMADYRELGGVVMVKPGDPVMRRVPPTPGVNGENVLGQMLPAQPGEEIPFAKECQGVAADDYDQNILVATVAGQPMLIDHGVQIEGTYRTKDIDLKTGNIHFDGTVQIDRDVMQGMRVSATGDININGSVEAAYLEAGGSITINGGVIGSGELRDETGQLSNTIAEIKAKGKITANFLQNALVEADGDIEILRSVAHSELTTTHGEIRVGPPGGSKGGNVMGGVLRAPKRVHVQVAGSQAHVETRIEVGVDPQLQGELDRIDGELEPKKADLIKLVRLITEINKQPEKYNAKIKDKARQTFLQLKQDVSHLTSHREKLVARLELIGNARVEVGREIFPGVAIRMGNLIHEFNEHLTGGIFGIADGEIGRIEEDEESEESGKEK